MKLLIFVACLVLAACDPTTPRPEALYFAPGIDGPAPAPAVDGGGAFGSAFGGSGTI